MAALFVPKKSKIHHHPPAMIPSSWWGRRWISNHAVRRKDGRTMAGGWKYYNMTNHMALLQETASSLSPTEITVEDFYSCGSRPSRRLARPSSASFSSSLSAQGGGGGGGRLLLSSCRENLHYHYRVVVTTANYYGQYHHNSDRYNARPQPRWVHATTTIDDDDDDEVHLSSIEPQHLQQPQQPQQETGSSSFCFSSDDSPKPQHHETKMVRSGNKSRINNWRTILDLYETTKRRDNDDILLHYTTTLTQLSNISTFVNTEAKHNTVLHEILTAVADRLDNPLFDPRCYGTILHAIAKLHVLDIVGNNDSSSSSKTTTKKRRQQHHSKIMVGKMNKNHDVAKRIVNHLSNDVFLNHLIEHIGGSGDPPTVSKVAWSLAILQRPALLNRFLAAAMAHEPCHQTLFFNDDTSTSPRAIATIIWACAKLEMKSSPSSSLFWEMVDARSDWLVDTGPTSDIAKIIWGLGKLRHPISPAFWTALARRAEWFVATAKVSEIVDTAWGLTQQQHHIMDDDNDHHHYHQKSSTTVILFFNAMETRSAWLIKHATPQEMATIASACATFGHRSPTLFSAIEGRSTWLVKFGTPRAVASTIGACATLGYNVPLLCAAMEPRMDWLVTHGTTNDVATTARALAMLNHESPKLIKAIERCVPWLCGTGSPRDVSSTAWAFARLHNQSPVFWAAVEKQVDWIVSYGDPQDIEDLAWAYATVNRPSSSHLLCAALDRRSEWFVAHGTPQHVATVARAMALLKCRSSSSSAFDKQQ
jgi:hypothetical protein